MDRKKVLKFLLLAVGYKVLKVLVVWWRRLRHLKSQAHISPIVSEYSDTPWTMLVNFAKNGSRLLDYRTEIFEKYRKKLKKPVKSISGCGLLFEGAPLVFTTDEEIFQHILKDNFNNYLRVDFGFKKVFGDSLLTVDHGPFAPDKGAFFMYQRKTASNIFTENKLDEMIQTAGLYHSQALLDKISAHIKSGSTKGFALKLEVSTMAFNIMCEVGFGYRFDSDEEREMYESAFEKIVVRLPEEYLNPLWKLPYAQYYIESKKIMVESVNKFSELCYKIIDMRLAEDDETRYNRGDLLSLFINASKDNVYSRTQLRDLVFLFLGAGRDTSGATMQWLTYTLATQPHIQEEIHKQTKDFIKKDPVTNIVTYERAKVKANLYLDGVCLEGLRMYPPVSLLGKVAQEDDVLPNGMQIKAGTAIFLDMYPMGRDETRYKNASKFTPERWTDPSRKAEVFDAFNLPVFGGGKRACIGQKLALQEVKLFLVSMTNRFKFELHPDEVKFMETEEVLYDSGQSTEYKGDILINAVERE